MPNRSQSPVILQASRTAAIAEVTTSTAIKPIEPFVLETVQRTMLKLKELPTPMPTSIAPSEAALTAMQRLVELIHTLRSPHASTTEKLAQRSQHDQLHTVEGLLPYVSEEAYDVLDALWHNQSQTLGSKASQNDRLTSQKDDLEGHQSNNVKEAPFTRHSPSVPLTLSSFEPLVAIETLSPYLLWCVARSAYSFMHLIEGIQVDCWQPTLDWASGMLRLVVMLEVETPTIRWCFDLATGSPPERLLPSIALVRSEEATLPIKPSHPAPGETSNVADQVDRQLQIILHVLQNETPELAAFLQGVAVDLLQPGTDWQTGTLQLRLGFEFSAQPADASMSFPRGLTGSDLTHPELTHLELIDAELSEGTATFTQTEATQDAATSIAIADAHVNPHALIEACSKAGEPPNVEEPPKLSLSPATLVRVADPTAVARYTQIMLHQQLTGILPTLQQQAADSEERALLPIVQTAIAIANDSSSQPTNAKKTNVNLGLLQPLLLIDELVPQLLWWVAGSTYDIMQLLGGIPIQLLQPNSNWQQGSLQLLAMLRLEAAGIDETIDLSTGRSVSMHSVELSTRAIVQSNASPLCQQPTQTETLLSHLCQQLCNAVPECEPLMHRVALEWLEEAQQDWQTGTLQLNFKLAFVPNGF